jgi:hypothetical protein
VYLLAPVRIQVRIDPVADLEGGLGGPPPPPPFFVRNLPSHVSKTQDLKPKIRDFFLFWVCVWPTPLSGVGPPISKFLDSPLRSKNRSSTSLRKRRLNGAVLRMRPENQGPVSQQVWHDKDPSLFNGPEPKFCSPSPV